MGWKAGWQGTEGGGSKAADILGEEGVTGLHLVTEGWRQGRRPGPSGVTGKRAKVGVQEGQQVRQHRLTVRAWALGER